MIRRALLPILILVLAAMFYAVGCGNTQAPATKADTGTQYAQASMSGQCPAASTATGASCQQGDSPKCSAGACPKACKAHTSAECTCTDAQKAACSCPHAGADQTATACTCPADGQKAACSCPGGQKATAACPAAAQGKTGMSCEKVCPEAQKGGCPAASQASGK
jgi:hypothetical protein